MSVGLALHDAATNCGRDGATAYVTLKSGVVIVGLLDKPTGPSTAHMRTPSGWVTILVEEIAAVEARR